jgi:hypothetical protein
MVVVTGSNPVVNTILNTVYHVNFITILFLDQCSDFNCKMRESHHLKTYYSNGEFHSPYRLFVMEFLEMPLNQVNNLAIFTIGSSSV